MTFQIRFIIIPFIKLPFMRMKNNQYLKYNIKSILASCMMLLALNVIVCAQTWDGSTDNLWTEGGNWGGSAPVNNGTANVVFDGNTETTVNIDAAQDVNSVTFDTTAGTFTLTNLALTIQSGGMTNQSANLQTFLSRIILGAGQTWTAQDGDFLLSRVTASGANTLILQGPDRFLFQANDNLLSTVDARGGTIVFSNAVNNGMITNLFVGTNTGSDVSVHLIGAGAGTTHLTNVVRNLLIGGTSSTAVVRLEDMTFTTNTMQYFRPNSNGTSQLIVDSGFLTNIVSSELDFAVGRGVDQAITLVNSSTGLIQSSSWFDFGHNGGTARLTVSNESAMTLSNTGSGVRFGAFNDGGVLNSTGYINIIDQSRLDWNVVGEVFAAMGDSNTQTNHAEIIVRDQSIATIRNTDSQRYAEDNGSAVLMASNQSALLFSNTGGSFFMGWRDNDAGGPGSNNTFNALYRIQGNSTGQIHSASEVFVGYNGPGTTRWEVLDSSILDVKAANNIRFGEDRGYFHGVVSNNSTLTMTNTGGQFLLGFRDDAVSNMSTGILQVLDGSYLSIRSQNELNIGQNENGYGRIVLDGSTGAFETVGGSAHMDLGLNGGVGEIILSNNSRASININGHLRMGVDGTASTGIINSVGGSGFDSVYVSGSVQIANGAGRYGAANFGDMQGGNLVLGMDNSDRVIANGLLMATNAVVDFNRNHVRTVRIGSEWNGNSGTVSFVDSQVQITNHSSLSIGQGGANRTGLLQVIGGSLRTDGTHIYIGRDANSSVGEVQLLNVTNAVMRANNDFYLGSSSGQGALRATNSTLTFSNTAGEYWFGLTGNNSTGIVQVIGGVFTQNMAGTGRTIYGFDSGSHGELTLRNTTNSYIRAGGAMEIAGQSGSRGLVDLGNFTNGTFIVTNGQFRVAASGSGARGTLIATNGTFMLGHGNHIYSGVGANTGEVSIVNATVNFGAITEFQVGYDNAAAKGNFDILGGTNNGQIATIRIGGTGGDGRVTFGGVGTITNTSNLHLANGANSEGLLVVSNGTLLVNHNDVLWSAANSQGTMQIGTGGEVRFQGSTINQNFTIQTNATLTMAGGIFNMTNVASHLVATNGATVQGFGTLDVAQFTARSGSTNTVSGLLTVTGDVNFDAGAVVADMTLGTDRLTVQGDFTNLTTFTLLDDGNQDGQYSVDLLNALDIQDVVIWNFSSIGQGPYMGGMRAASEVFSTFITNNLIVLGGAATGRQLTYIQDGSHYYLYIEAIPEPSTYAMMIFGGILLFFYYRRSKKSDKSTQES